MYPNDPRQQPGQFPPQQPQGAPPSYPPQSEAPMFSPLPESTPEAPIDYLDQMTAEQLAKQQKKSPGLMGFLSGLTRLQVAIGGGILLLLCGFGLLNTYLKDSGPDIGGMSRTLVGHVAALKEITKDSPKKIKNSRLAGLNSTLYVHLGGMQTGLVEKLPGTKDTPKTILKSKSFEKTVEKLEDARLNGIYDRSLVTETDYYLTQIDIAITQLHTSLTNAETRTYLKENQEKIKVFLRQLDDVKKDIN